MAVLTIALWLNVVVLTGVVVVLVGGGRLAVRLWGQTTPARGIVLAYALAALATTIVLLVWPIEPAIVTLLALLIASQVLTVFTIRVLTSPIVIGSAILATVHTGLLVLHTLPV